MRKNEKRFRCWRDRAGLVIGGPAATANAAWKTILPYDLYPDCQARLFDRLSGTAKKVYYFQWTGHPAEGWITVDKKVPYADAKTGEIAISKWESVLPEDGFGGQYVDDGKWVWCGRTLYRRKRRITSDLSQTMADLLLL